MVVGPPATAARRVRKAQIARLTMGCELDTYGGARASSALPASAFQADAATLGGFVTRRPSTLIAVCALSLALSPVLLSQSVENAVDAALSRLRLHNSQGDTISSGPVTWQRSWFAFIINTIDGAGPVINPRIEWNTGLPLTGFFPNEPAVFSANAAAGNYVWQYNSLLPEATAAQSFALESPATEIADVQYSGTRVVTPQLLTAASTLQTVTFRFTLDQPFPADATAFSFRIGTPEVLIGGFNLVTGTVVAQAQVPGWTAFSTGRVAEWIYFNPGAIPVGTTFTFEATVLSVKSPALAGSPVFKPQIFTTLSFLSSFQELKSTTTAFLQNPTEPISVHFSAQNPLTWKLFTFDPTYDFHLAPQVSEITSAPPFRVKVPATVRIEPTALNTAAKGVVTAFIELSDPYNTAEIDPSTITCQSASATSVMFAGKKVIAKFDRQQLGAINGPTVALKVTGLLNDGSVFEGSDVLRIVK
jgi:hypothetical protein